ncbi:MAG: hypothetical protein FJ368_06515 [Pelagibacterales bacterium]|nr:hypothetical protein [Pelagibacterales bacterium]
MKNLKKKIKILLERNGTVKTAKLMGIAPQTLYRKMSELGIPKAGYSKCGRPKKIITINKK